MRTIFNTSEETACAAYSESLIRGVIVNEILAKASPSNVDTIIFNSSCVFFAVAYLEVKLNEIVTQIYQSKSQINEGVPERYWELLKENEKKFRIQDKWDYIAAAHNGYLWDSSSEPFQSFEIIKSLRNELIHFKGDQIKLGIAPQKKLNSLLQKFTGPELDYRGEAIKSIFGKGQIDWTTQLLSSPEFGEWIAQKILIFDLEEKKLLKNEQLSENEKNHYWSKWTPAAFAIETPEDFSKVEEILIFMEKIVLPVEIQFDNSKNRKSFFMLLKSFISKTFKN